MLAIAGSFACCSVVVLFVCVVLLCVLFEPFKVVGVVVVWCAGNNKVVRWCGGGGVCRVVWCGVDSLRVGWLGCG